MYADIKATHLQMNGAYRSFAESETLSEVAQQAGIRSAQMLRNKLCLEQPHQLTASELVSITKASKNRCIVDGLLLELNCAPSVSLDECSNADKTPLTERALEITANAGQLASLAIEMKAQKRVTERMRHEIVNRSRRVMSEIALFAFDVESKFQAVPLLSIAIDAVPMPGLT